MSLQKNATNSLIVFLLIFNQLGINQSMHFCGGRLFSVSFLNEPKQCGMHESNSEKEDDSYNFNSKKCCKDYQLYFSTNDFQNELISELNCEIKSLKKVFYNNLVVDSYWTKKPLKNLHPPPLLKKKLYLLNFQLLVYG